MRLNLEKTLGFLALFVTFNIISNAVAPLVIYAADEVPTSFPVEPPVEVSRNPVRLDINLMTLESGFVCGLGSAVANDGLELKIQNWYSDYTLQARYYFVGGSFGSWINPIGLPNTQFVVDMTIPTNATYTAMNATDLPAGASGVEFRVLDSEMQVLTLDEASTPTADFMITQDPESVVCGGIPEVQTYDISGYKFEDANENSMPDPEIDTPLISWVVRLYDSSWNFVLQNATDENGFYRFINLEAGTYYTCEVNQIDWNQVYPDAESGVANLSEGENEAAYCNVIAISEGSEVIEYAQNDFVNVEETIVEPTYTISGKKYEDANLNFELDESDTTVSNWEIHLYAQVEEGWEYIDDTLTGETGTYNFSNLTAGTYYVCEAGNSSWFQYPINISRLVLNNSDSSNEGPACYKVVFDSESDEESINNDFLNIHLVNLIVVVKQVVGRHGEVEATSDQEFAVNLYSGDEVLEYPTKYISDSEVNVDEPFENLIVPHYALYRVEPGTYQVQETTVPGFMNLGCKPLTESSTSEENDNDVVVGEGEVVIVECTNQIVNLIPTVVIVAIPANNVTQPTTILLTANAAGGDGSLTYQWTCNTGETGTASTLTLNSVGSHQCLVVVKDVDGDIAAASGTYSIAQKPVTPITNNPTTPTQTDTTTPEQTGTVDEGISTEEKPDKVLGLQAQVCDTKSTVSGYVFIDKNGNNAKDSDEEGIEGVDLTLTVNVVDEDGITREVEVRTLKTNTLGRWETSLCAGTYKIKLDTQDLPEAASLGGDDHFEFNVEEDTAKSDVNFAVKQAEINTNTNWWLFLIPLVLLVLAAGGYAIYSTNQKRKSGE